LKAFERSLVLLPRGQI